MSAKNEERRKTKLKKKTPHLCGMTKVVGPIRATPGSSFKVDKKELFSAIYTGIMKCINCGSTDHLISECRLKKVQDYYILPNIVM